MPDGLQRRLHGWAAARFVWWAAWFQTAALISTAYRDVAILIVVAAFGLWLRWRLNWRTVVFITAPTAALLRFGGYDTTIKALIVAAWAYTATRLIVWAATELHITADHLEIRFGVWNRRKVQVPRRQLAQLKESAWPAHRLLGYTHLKWETSADVEFYGGGIRYAPSGLYGLLTDPAEYETTVGAVT